MNKHLISTIFAIATLCMACDKINGDVENGNTTSTNPYPYLRVCDIEIFYGKSISDAENILYGNGYQGGYVSNDKYKYYKGNDTIYLDDFFEDKTIKSVDYYSSLKINPTEAREWLLHSGETYNGSISCKFASAKVGVGGANDYATYQSLISNLNSSQRVDAIWISETNKGVGFVIDYDSSETNRVAGIAYGMAHLFGEEKELPEIIPPTEL